MRPAHVDHLPWPVDALIDRLAEGDLLHALCRKRDTGEKRAVREHLLEGAVSSLLRELHGNQNVLRREYIYKSLECERTPFPGECTPDVVWKHDEMLHICELKSNTVNRSRTYSEVGKKFREYLVGVDYRHRNPTEVEQDLIKLMLFRKLSARVGSCLFVMVDAYRGRGVSWTKVFSEREVFLSQMRTALVRERADAILSTTAILPLTAERMNASAIVVWNP